MNSTPEWLEISWEEAWGKKYNCMDLHQSCEMASAFLWQSLCFFPLYYWKMLRSVSKFFQAEGFNVSIQALVKITLPVQI